MSRTMELISSALIRFSDALISVLNKKIAPIQLTIQITPWYHPINIIRLMLNTPITGLIII